MKKSFLIALISLVFAFGLYFNRAYSHIYDHISNVHRVTPYTQTDMSISPKTGHTTKELVYVALGDSLTAGVGSDDFHTTFPYEFAEQIAEHDGVTVRLINLGVPGARTADVVRTQLPVVASLNPDVITLLVGVNDMHGFVGKKVVAHEMQTLLTALTRTTHAKILVMNIPFLGSRQLMYPPYQTFFDWQTNQYNEAITPFLTLSDVTFINLYDNTKEYSQSNQTYYSTDGFHPSAEGYHLWSAMLYANYR